MPFQDTYQGSEGVEENPAPAQNSKPSEETEGAAVGLKRQKHRDWCRKNREKRRESNLRYRLRHLDRVAESNRKQYLKNRQARREYNRRYHYLNREKRRQYARKYHLVHYQKNRERLLAQSSAYAKSHPKVRRKCYLNYKKNHPDRYRAQIKAMHVKRKAMMRGADVGCAVVDSVIKGWRISKTFQCYWCGDKLPTRKMHIDHIVAISRGGKHEASNVCRSCPLCNLRKNKHFQSEPLFRGQMALL